MVSGNFANASFSFFLTVLWHAHSNNSKNSEDILVVFIIEGVEDAMGIYYKGESERLEKSYTIRCKIYIRTTATRIDNGFSIK